MAMLTAPAPETTPAPQPAGLHGEAGGNLCIWGCGSQEEGPGVYPLASAILSLTSLSWCHGIQLSLHSGCHPHPPRSHGTAIFCNLPPTPPQKVAGASHKPSSDRKSQLLAGSSEAWVGLQSCPHSGPETVYQRPTLGETVSMVPAMRLQWEASSRAQPAEGDQGGLGRAQNSDPMQYPSQFQCSV